VPQRVVADLESLRREEAQLGQAPLGLLAVDATVPDPGRFADPNDRASQESDMSLELRNRDRERKLIKKIDETIARIDAGPRRS
jgi:RNA polymerase-binding transcription factor DksA